MNGRTLFYRRIASPLHATRATVGASWALSLMVAALVLYHPIALLALLTAVLLAAVPAHLGWLVPRALRTALIVAVPIVAVNVLVSRQGLTVFARIGDLGPFGQGDLTLEALLYGAVIALKVALLIVITTLGGLAVDPDELLGVFRRLSFRSALTASLATRMLPVLAADAQRLAEAQRTRADAGPRRARSRVLLLGAVIGGSLDRALDVAATLEVRGFSSARRAPRSVRPWSRHDLGFAASAAAIIVLTLLGRFAGVAPFSAYPAVHLPVRGGTLVLATGLMLAVLLPFCNRRGIEP
jgi:energy-coupling factor transport system permease protein